MKNNLLAHIMTTPHKQSLTEFVNGIENLGHRLSTLLTSMGLSESSLYFIKGFKTKMDLSQFFNSKNTSTNGVSERENRSL
ncbi:hypothetical protein CR513_40061, partial [Mucuna pruriens]